MNRWNTKGSVHAKRRMEELRRDKEKKAYGLALFQWSQRNGVDLDRDGAWLNTAERLGYPRQAEMKARVNWLNEN